jgi:HD-like signal output (HDOD) protein
MSQLAEIVRALRTMPPLPNVAQRVLQIVRDPEFSIDELVAIVRVDPALTARILKLCNSALYGLSHEVTSVADAVAYLGTRNLVKLTLVSCTATYFQATRQSHYADAKELWRHTLSCAIACQWLANRCGYPQPDTAFTAGILHNVGKVAMSQMADDTLIAALANELADSDRADHIGSERRLFGIDHATAGGIVTEAWNLPMELRRAVRFHHDERHVNGDSALPAILNLADTLVLGMGIGNPFPAVPVSVQPTVLLRLHLDESEVEAAAAHVTAELARSAELLNLDGLTGR